MTSKLISKAPGAFLAISLFAAVLNVFADNTNKVILGTNIFELGTNYDVTIRTNGDCIVADGISPQGRCLIMKGTRPATGVIPAWLFEPPSNNPAEEAEPPEQPRAMELVPAESPAEAPGDIGGGGGGYGYPYGETPYRQNHQRKHTQPRTSPPAQAAPNSGSAANPPSWGNGVPAPSWGRGMNPPSWGRGNQQNK